MPLGDIENAGQKTTHAVSILRLLEYDDAGCGAPVNRTSTKFRSEHGENLVTGTEPIVTAPTRSGRRSPHPRVNQSSKSDDSLEEGYYI